MPRAKKAKAKQKPLYRVTLTFVDNGTFGKVFQDAVKAKKYAIRQKRSLVVKGAKVEKFIRQAYYWRAALREGEAAKSLRAKKKR